MAEQKDHWSTEAYQHSASFVPGLAGKIVEWLDVQPDDKILDVGCGDGVLDAQFAETLSRGTGLVHGIDSSPAMIAASKARAGHLANCTFEVADATAIPATAPHLRKGSFTKVFSNAALHWVLRPDAAPHPASGASVFGALREALAPGGLLVFEMGGLGNVAEMRAALLGAVARRIGTERARAADPWFFPDEEWVRRVLEREEGGGGRWVVERVEREWRPTMADAGGVEGWVALMGGKFFDAVPEGEREACAREATEVLKHVCAAPAGGEMISYVRLRCRARRV